LLFGCYITFGNLLDPLFGNFGYTSGQIVIIGAVFIIMGVVGSLTAGKVLDKTGKYVFLLRSITIAATTMCTVVLISLSLSFPFGLCLLFIAIMGFSLIPIVSVSYALSVELTHPISPPLANGLMVGGG
jgi:MFS family permease